MSQQSKYKSKCLNNLTQSWKVVKLGSSSCNKRSEQDAHAQIGFKPLEGRYVRRGGVYCSWGAQKHFLPFADLIWRQRASSTRLALMELLKSGANIFSKV